MSNCYRRFDLRRAALLSIALLCLRALDGFGVPNNWTNSSGGLWRVATNWSAATAPNSSSNVDPTQITNANNKPVTVDADTPAANLSLRALTISAPAGSTNTLRLVDLPTPLTTSGALLVTNRGVLEITNSSVSA